jgi:hypothetical protein
MTIPILRKNNTVDHTIKFGDAFSPYSNFNGAIIPNCLLRYKNISPTAKLTLVRLFQYAGKDKMGNPKDHCWPTQTTLAEEIGVSRVRMNKIIKELVDNKFLRIVRVKGQDKLLHKPNKYYYLWHPVYSEDNYTLKEEIDKEDETGATGYEEYEDKLDTGEC